ncbi:hypothetical protein CBR_g23215 [Chara braunii]|uniref:HAT C-terminal dimerisation domain-containing protein n=1 Tax=Chara braunii TaxID=69332 RepID=A0A388JV98_CHABU|nr:hypothetical protein CBR_g23215 [Chara braunii]|eukprot:GBG61700.1 hypothetical protein CBR_g23215 [Chara braunii]
MRWVDNAAQKKLDIAWAEAMFWAGIAFNFLNFDTTLKLNEVYLEVASARPKVKLPSAKHIRTVMLDFIFLHIQNQVQPLTACWDVTGCTFITNGSTDQRGRPVMNFLAAGEQGEVLVATVSMDGKKKTGPALAKLWEKIMREIGLQCINAICTDNAEVNKKAAQILEWRTNLQSDSFSNTLFRSLLRDINKFDWIKGTVKRSHTIVKFIRNKHCTHSLMMSLDDSLLLLRPTEVRFGSVYMMMERWYDRRAILKQMVEGSLVGRWKAMRWSTTKLQSKADLVFFTSRSEGWWPELKKVVAVMEPLYVLLRRMDKDGTAPSNLVEYDRLLERILAEVVLAGEQRRTVLEKVRDRMKMMRQPGHALAFLLDPRRREPKWLLDRDIALVQNAFSPSEWWATHVGDVPELQAIAMKVMGMCSTVTPAERNWSSMDLVHSKRRNQLNPSTLEKLVYIHWNIQLLHSEKNLKDVGYIDLWAQFFESLPEPEADDRYILKDPVEEKDKTEEELVQERAFIKTPKGRILKSLEDEEEEEDCTDDNDLDDEVWKGKTSWSEASSEGEVDESSDDDFELEIPSSIPCTTYVGRREAAQRRRERPPTTPSQCMANTTAHYSIQSDIEVPQTDTDMEMTLHRSPINTDEEEADRAKAWADADQERVQRRMREEEERRATIPTRRELEKLKKKVGEQESEPVGNTGPLEEEKDEAMGQREEEAEHEIGQPREEEEKMEEQEEGEEEAGMEQQEEEEEEGEEEAGMEQREEMEQEQGECTKQQEEELERSSNKKRRRTSRRRSSSMHR